MDYSLTIQGGNDGWACYVKSNNDIFEPRTVTDGYTDGNVAAYHIFQAQKLSPLLLALGGRVLPAVHDNTLNITVIFDPTTSLPRYIRSYEDNHVFGPSTSDLQVYNYTQVEGVMFPRNIKELYNRDSGSVLQDFFIYDIEVNPTIDPSFFDGLSRNQTQSTPSAPIIEFDYGFAEIGEWDSNMLWGGKYKGKSSNVSATHPIPTVPQLWHITFLDSTGYTQIVMEFEDAVIVGEAPVHQSQQVIQWVRDTLGKNITHIWSTHHHHDHSYGTRDYIAAGAKAIVIDTAVDYWSNIPGIEFITYSASEPYIHRDANIEARFLGVFDKHHAEDMSYAFISAPCPGPSDTVAIFEADLWNPGFTDYRFDQEQALVLLDQAAKDGVSRNAVVIPVHGVEAPLEGLIDATDYNYPNYTAVDFKAGGKLCTGGQY
ncbi:hypothetical protein G7Y89_g9947 [Cudoniella acicularis]|uniref:Metallo-beta-lactamase domain-containing protein n=1 Tax=Cudoniella acicularis TaxID=354080 RepID=A0A8H4REQ3_9HELO|nr:hypothetical protein G7Y89_g9947 [Cudoniella acicularis]